VNVTSLAHGAFQSRRSGQSVFSHHRRRCARAAPRHQRPSRRRSNSRFSEFCTRSAPPTTCTPIGFHETAQAPFRSRRGGPRFQRRAGRAVFERAPASVTRAFAAHRFVRDARAARRLPRPKTAERVLAGRVQRGDVEELDAVVWFFRPARLHADDRRRFAARADRMLNDYLRRRARHHKQRWRDPEVHRRRRAGGLARGRLALSRSDVQSALEPPETPTPSSTCSISSHAARAPTAAARHRPTCRSGAIRQHRKPRNGSTSP